MFQDRSTGMHHGPKGQEMQAPPGVESRGFSMCAFCLSSRPARTTDLCSCLCFLFLMALPLCLSVFLSFLSVSVFTFSVWSSLSLSGPGQGEANRMPCKMAFREAISLGCRPCPCVSLRVSVDTSPWCRPCFPLCHPLPLFVSPMRLYG